MIIHQNMKTIPNELEFNLVQWRKYKFSNHFVDLLIHINILLKISQHRCIKYIINHNLFPENKMKKAKHISYQNYVSKYLISFWCEGSLENSKQNKPFQRKKSPGFEFAGWLNLDKLGNLKLHGFTFKKKMRWRLWDCIQSFILGCVAHSINVSYQWGWLRNLAVE